MSLLQVGWGFTDATPFARQPDLTISPQQKREHLFSFWKQNIGRPMALVGGSLGGAIALDFAMAYPEAVEKLVLIDAQVSGAGPSLVPQVLRLRPQCAIVVECKQLQHCQTHYEPTRVFHQVAMAVRCCADHVRCCFFLQGFPMASLPRALAAACNCSQFVDLKGWFTRGATRASLC